MPDSVTLRVSRTGDVRASILGLDTGGGSRSRHGSKVRSTGAVRRIHLQLELVTSDRSARGKIFVDLNSIGVGTARKVRHAALWQSTQDTARDDVDLVEVRSRRDKDAASVAEGNAITLRARRELRNFRVGQVDGSRCRGNLTLNCQDPAVGYDEELAVRSKAKSPLSVPRLGMVPTRNDSPVSGLYTPR